MKLTIEVPDSLGERLNHYLKKHPEETLLSVIQEALEIKLISKDTAKHLESAGTVTEGPDELSQRDPWEVFLSLGDEAEPGQLESASIAHDRYLYQQP